MTFARPPMWASSSVPGSRGRRIDRYASGGAATGAPAPAVLTRSRDTLGAPYARCSACRLACTLNVAGGSS